MESKFERQSFTTGNPGELTRHLTDVRRTNPDMTVAEAYAAHVSPNHYISEVWASMISAGFPENEVSENFRTFETKDSSL